MYKPNPVDTSEVILDEEILMLAEMLAKNTHEVWAKNRMAEGWSYGKERNDLKKETPCMVEYEQLTETEKAYDRNTALETLKLIIKLGYKIEKN